MKVTLKKLQIFVHAARHDSLKEAAKACFISQAGASQALIELEDSLGPLFDRVGKRLQINHNGRKAYPKALEIVDRAKDLEESVIEHAEQFKGEIFIGASTTIGNYKLPKFIAQFKEKYPLVHVNLLISNTHTILHALHKLSLDFAYIEDSYEDKQVSVRPWAPDKLVIVCHNSHPLAKKQRIKVNDVKTMGWVCREQGSGTQRIMISTFSKHFTPKVEIELTSSEAIKNYIMHRHSLAFLSMSSVINEINNHELKILKIAPLTVDRTFYRVMHINKYQSALAKFFHDTLN